MGTPTPTSDEPLVKEPPEFSLVHGGPLFQLWRQAHLSDNALRHLARRVIVLSLLAWLPLLVLSVLGGHAWGRSVTLPFLFDIDVHVRLLVALPLFIVAEPVVYQRMRLVVRQFVDRGLVADTARGEFDAAIASAMRLRNSVVAEIVILALVYSVGVMLIWRHHAAIEVTSWYGTMAEGNLQPSLAGWWFGCLSLPLVQFILFRWLFRLFIWARFLWHMSRMELNLIPTHPDRAAGLGFLSSIPFAFAPLIVGQGILLAGTMANKIFFMKANLTHFKLELIAMVVVMIIAVLGPLSVFVPRLGRAKRRGLFEFGTLAQRYVREFDQKWLRGGAPPDESLVGSGDIQSLADLASSFGVVKSMKLAPFTKETVLSLVVLTLLPVVPLVLTMIPVGELFNRLLKIIF